MQTRFGHMQINVRETNLPFYRDLLTFLGWTILAEEGSMLGIGDDKQTSLWFVGTEGSDTTNRDGIGINHLAIQTTTQTEVDTAAAWLTDRGVSHLFETPRHRPEFAWKEGQTYYQVMFESPDGLLFEIVYIGPLQA